MSPELRDKDTAPGTGLEQPKTDPCGDIEYQCPRFKSDLIAKTLSISQLSKTTSHSWFDPLGFRRASESLQYQIE